MPVAQSGHIQVPLAEPAVVHDKQLDPHPGGVLGHLDQFFSIEIQVYALPAVEEDGTAGCLVSAPAEVAPVSPVVDL